MVISIKKQYYLNQQTKSGKGTILYIPYYQRDMDNGNHINKENMEENQIHSESIIKNGINLKESHVKECQFV